MKLLLLLALMLTPVLCTADDIFIVVLKKQQEKEKRGWNLADWMSTKRKISLMDQWLALNSSASLFEFYLNADSANYKLDSSKKSLWRGSTGMFISILGFEGEYEKSTEDYTALTGTLSLRLLGASNQNTNISMLYGYKQLESASDQFQNSFWGCSLTLNIVRNFGVTSSYRKYLKQISDRGYDTSGTLWEAGAFIDISFLRFHALWFEEKLTLNTQGNDSEQTRTGTRLGLKIYF